MIYIIRHGQTDLNKERKTQGRKGLPLNQTGRDQAEQLKKQLKTVHFDYVFSSPQERAVETARIATGIEPITDKRIDVFDFGTADNLRMDEIKMRGLTPDPTVYSGVEDAKDYIKRIFSFMNELETKYANQNVNILISGHKDTTGCMSAYFEGMPSDGNILKLSLPNGQMKTYKFKK